MRADNRPRQPRSPSRALYSLACFYTREILAKKKNIAFDSSAIAGVKPPVLALCNHEGNDDFLIAAAALLPLRFNFMVTTYFFHHSLLGRLLRFMGCIPKRQFRSDVGAVKSVLGVIERGESVCIFPEGQVCYAGLCNSIEPGIGKLVKKLGVTVITHSVRGNYLSSPKWACGASYRGLIESRAEVLFTPDEVAALTVDEINARIARALYYDEFAWQRERHAAFSPARLAEGLETVLYRCPSCESDLAMRAEGSSLVCERCGYRASFDECGFFKTETGESARFDAISDWFRWQRECAEREYGEGFSFSTPCALSRTVEGKYGYTPCGGGVMTADPSGLRFEGERLGEPFALAARVERQSNVTHNAATHAVDIEGDDANYALAPSDPRAMSKFIILYEIARSRFERKAINRDSCQ